MPTLRLRFPSNRTLANICVYGAIASVSAVMYMHWSFQDRIRRTEYFRLAFNTLRHHRGAISLLGEPIKDSGFDLANTNNSCDAEHAQFEVKVRGPKDKGTVYFWATNNNENGWLIDRLELETKQHPNKRFLLKRALDDQASKHLEPSAEAKKYLIVSPESGASPPVEKPINPETNASDNNVQQHPAAASEPSVRDHGNDSFAKHQHQQHTSELPASVTDVQTDVATTAPSAAAAAAHANRVSEQHHQHHQLHQTNESVTSVPTSELNHQINEASSHASSEPGDDQKENASKHEQHLGMIDDHIVLVVNQEGPHTNKCTNQNHYSQRN